MKSTFLSRAVVEKATASCMIRLRIIGSYNIRSASLN